LGESKYAEMGVFGVFTTSVPRIDKSYTGGQAGRWAMLHSIARRLVLRDHEEVDRAAKLAKENGWLELKGLYSTYG